MYIIDEELEKKEILKRYRNIFTVWRSNISKDDKKLIRKAFNLAVNAHKDTRRRTGEPYIYHPLEVAYIAIQEIGLGTTSVICALLHDVVEDTDYTIADIEALFGSKVAQIIDGLTKIEEIFDHTTLSLQAENFKKILLTLSDDVRVILIKLADRLHNMRTLDAMPKDKQLKIASETIYLYAPLAHRLGLHAIKSELEDLSLKYTEPAIYETISTKLKESELERARFIGKFIYPIKKALSERGINYTITGRAKSISSIRGKMKKKEIPFEEVFDLFAIRIIIDTPLENEKSDCWNVYTIVTGFYRPNPDRLRDWISIPKGNGYEALHTTVMSHSGKWVEVQIRTKRMDEIAEKGYAAHWKYKDSDIENNKSESGLDDWLNRIKEILQNPEANALDFLADFKLNLFAEEIFVFTPKGDMKTLPVNSTVLDFAYNIHSDIGNHCIGAKVNHKLVSTNYQLQSGDQVEIITSSKQIPKEEWYESVVTAKAKLKIKAALKEVHKSHSEDGRIVLQKLFAQLNVEFNKTNIGLLKEFLKIQGSTQLFYMAFSNKLTIKDLKTCFQSEEKTNWINYINPFTLTKKAIYQPIVTLADEIRGQIKNKPETLMLGEKNENLKYIISDCCNPIPGDDVIGLITPGEGINIHRTNCEKAIQLMSKYGNRIVKAKWKENEDITFLTGIKITGIDKKGVVKDISRLISEDLNINIRSFNLQSSEGVFEGLIMIYVSDTKHLKDLMKKLKQIEGIQKIIRMS
ncbi:MAG: bifunctional (p)ppGpp synthetase/guanosine-3',5'-bis(diphosphate) 3'-pyrophosphohydrolase [Bacteroidetes bacterium]|nr:bifunctional (p)ppGpp synthetase/guanosine-3',5'-bis(diphosphate) 3'-pyrophosphohydrolase [Bacteroidota bacterium]